MADDVGEGLLGDAVRGGLHGARWEPAAETVVESSPRARDRCAGSRGRRGATSCGCGVSGAVRGEASSPRRNDSTPRTSSSPVALSVRMFARASRARSGSLSNRCRPTPDCTAIWLSEWASTSWSSRAMRVRSSCSAVRRRSCSCSRRSAPRSRRRRMASPMAKQAARPTVVSATRKGCTAGVEQSHGDDRDQPCRSDRDQSPDACPAHHGPDDRERERDERWRCVGRHEQIGEGQHRDHGDRRPRPSTRGEQSQGGCRGQRRAQRGVGERDALPGRDGDRAGNLDQERHDDRDEQRDGRRWAEARSELVPALTRHALDRTPRSLSVSSDPQERSGLLRGEYARMGTMRVQGAVAASRPSMIRVIAAPSAHCSARAAASARARSSRGRSSESASSRSRSLTTSTTVGATAR